MNKVCFKVVLSRIIVRPILVLGHRAVDPDPNQLLLKKIPDKLMVLNFDDAPARQATGVAPILKNLGFGGSI